MRSFIAACILAAPLSTVAANPPAPGAFSQLRLKAAAYRTPDLDMRGIRLAGAEGKEGGEAQDVVLGTFENGTDILFWYMRDVKSGYTSKSLRGYITENPFGKRDVFEVLSGLDGGWLVMRDPMEENPYYICYADGSVLYLPVDASIELEGDQEPLKGGAMTVSGDSLFAAYGGAQAGTALLMKFSPDPQAVRTQAAVLYYEDGTLHEAQVSDADALPGVFDLPKLAAAAAAIRPTKKQKAHAAYRKLEAFLRGGPDRMLQITFNSSGGVLFKLRDAGKDTGYIFLKGATVKEFAAD